MKEVCKNCGGDRGIHHYKTMQCPVGGVESYPRKQEYMTTIYEEGDDIDILKEEISLLRTAIDNLIERIEDLENKDISAQIRDEIYGHEETFHRGE